MKSLRKSEFPKQADAEKHLSEKFGLKSGQLVLKKPHKTKWIFDIVPWVDKKKLYAEAFAKFRKDNPNMGYRQAVSVFAQIQKAKDDVA